MIQFLTSINWQQLIITVVSSSLIGGIVGAWMKGLYDRNVAKKAPKTSMRAEAYKDFVIYALAKTQSPDKLDELKARLIVSGESKVVKELAKYLSKKNKGFDNEKDKREALCELVLCIRGSLRTSQSDGVNAAIKEIISDTLSRDYVPEQNKLSG